MGLTSPNISHEPERPKYNRQEPGGSMSDCFMLVPKETCPKSNRQEPIGSTSDCVTLVINKIRHVHTHNKIAAPLINNTHKTDITKKCNSLHQKYIGITENMWAQKSNAGILVNSNMTLIALLI